jgi:outer membrane protein
MKPVRILAAAAVASTLVLPAVAAEPNPWLVRVRALYMKTADRSEAIPSLGVAANDVTVNNKWFPEVDISYFFTKHVAAELVLTYPQKHDVTVEESVLGGPVKIGTFKHLPPTLSLQYHFNPDGDIRPYVGAGVNLTFILSDKLAIPGVGNLSLDSTSVGAAYGAGFDFNIARNTVLNFDVKKVYIGSDVKLGGTKVSAVKVDPLLWSVGLGWRF